MTPKLQPGQTAPDFRLPCTDGSTIHLAQELKRYPLTVVMFLCNHCPYVQAYIPRLIELQEQFKPSPAGPGHPGTPGTPGAPGTGARFLGICSNDAATYPLDSFENMKIYAKQWGLNFPYLRDEDQSVARAYGAERTPEIFVLDPRGVCRYEGGIDDNYQDPAKVTQRPLRDALETLLAGRPVRVPQSYAIGCTIKWKKS